MDPVSIRTVGLVVAVVCTVAIAGCSVPELGDCGPGEDSIGAISESQNVTVQGTIQSINETSIVVDDGTGTALLVTDRKFETEGVEAGDCVTASGRSVGQNDSTRYDTTILAGNVTAET